jgi:alcohol dehydrogenase
MPTMKAARLHKVGGSFQVDEIEVPVPGDDDVLIEVKSANLVQNLRNVIATYPIEKPFLPLPELPAIFGMDTAGVIAATGRRVRNLRVGQRVYLNPGRATSDSWASRTGDPLSDPDYTFQGYFGFGPNSVAIHRDYPQGGLCEYVKGPASGIIVIPDNVSFDQASRFGYLGTSYASLLKGGVRAGSTVMILGATGTLGVGAVLLALAMGATKILGVARNAALLERLKTIAPHRISVLSYGTADLGAWAREQTEGRGADVCIDALNHTAGADVTMSGIWALRRGGVLVFIGAMPDVLPLPIYRLMTLRISVLTSLWFSVAEGEDMARMASAGTLDLSHFEAQHFRLSETTQALAAASERAGGFTSIIVRPGD